MILVLGQEYLSWSVSAEGMKLPYNNPGFDALGNGRHPPKNSKPTEIVKTRPTLLSPALMSLNPTAVTSQESCIYKTGYDSEPERELGCPCRHCGVTVVNGRISIRPSLQQHYLWDQHLIVPILLFQPLSKILKFDSSDKPGRVTSQHIKNASFTATEIIPQRNNSGFFFYPCCRIHLDMSKQGLFIKCSQYKMCSSAKKTHLNIWLPLTHNASWWRNNGRWWPRTDLGEGIEQTKSGTEEEDENDSKKKETKEDKTQDFSLFLSILNKEMATREAEDEWWSDCSIMWMTGHSPLTRARAHVAAFFTRRCWLLRFY